ncbi:MAG: carboxypeptidase-like regulatory domain-containing protein [Planctomycetota bacterium]
MKWPERLGIAVAVLLAAGAAFVVGRRSLDGGSRTPDGGSNDLGPGAFDVPEARERAGLAVPPPERPFVPPPPEADGVPTVQDAAQARALGRHVPGVVRCRDGLPLPSGGVLSLHVDGQQASSTDVVDGAFDVWIASDGPYDVRLSFGPDVVTARGQALAADGSLAVVLPARSERTVQVRDDDGHAVAGASVRCMTALESESSSSREERPTPADLRALDAFRVEDVAALDASGRARVVTDAAGRARLPRTWSGWYVVVEAPGFARRHAFVRGDDAEVRLAPGGDVEVTVVDPSNRRASVRFTADGADFDAAVVVPGADGRAVSPRFAQGPVDVELRSLDGGPPIATTTVTVVPGRTVPVTLRPPPPTPIVRTAAVDVEGTVRIPAAWGLAFPDATWMLRLEPRSRAPGREARSALLPRGPGDAVAFDFRAIEAGPYTAHVDPVGWSQDVEVAPDASVLRLSVPAPVVVRIDAVDDDSGADVAIGDTWLSYAFAWFEPWRGPRSASPRQLWLPSTRAPLIVHAKGYAPAVVDIGPFDEGTPSATVVVRLRRAATLEIVARVDGREARLAELELRWGATADAQPFWARARLDAALQFDALPIGTGWVSVAAARVGGEFLSLAPSAPRRINLRPGETTTLEVDLTTRP